MNKMTIYTIETPERLRQICIENKWFTEGSTRQYEKMFCANKMGAPLEEIATIIWLCTDCETPMDGGVTWCRRDILEVLKKTQQGYRNRLSQEDIYGA